MIHKKNFIYIAFILCSIVSLTFAFFYDRTKTVDFDEYKIAVAHDVIENRDDNTENVMLTLMDQVGLFIIIQNKINILATQIFSKLEGRDLLESMHVFKFSGYIKDMNGYDESTIEIITDGRVHYTTQRFKHTMEGKEVMSDLRIVQLNSDYYAFYAMIIDNRQESLKALEDAMNSLEELNFN